MIKILTCANGCFGSNTAVRHRYQIAAAKKHLLNSAASQTGDGTQTLGLNRTEFTVQLKVGTFSTGK